MSAIISSYGQAPASRKIQSFVWELFIELHHQLLLDLLSFIHEGETWTRLRNFLLSDQLLQNLPPTSFHFGPQEKK